MPPTTKTNAHPIELKTCRQRSHKGRGRGIKALVLQNGRHQIENGLHVPFGDGVLSGVLFLEEDLKPGSPPMELPQHSLELSFRTRIDVEDDDTA